MHLWVNFLHYPSFKKPVVSTIQPQDQASQESVLTDKLRRVLKGTAFVVGPLSGTPSISTQPAQFTHTPIQLITPASLFLFQLPLKLWVLPWPEDETYPSETRTLVTFVLSRNVFNTLSNHLFLNLKFYF